MNANQDSSFAVNSAHQSFIEKQKSLFDELDKVKITLPDQISMDIEEDEKPTDQSETKTYKGMTSIFKRPEAPLRRCLPPRKTPDYQVNPHKWTKYTLDDVRYEDMSERSNKSAALTFLKDLEKRNEANRSNIEDDSKETVVKFNKSALIDVPEDKEEKATFKSSKVVMPEYVIGQKIKKNRKNQEKRSGHASKQLTLNHLIEDEEDENT